jgi:hypothetical protein
MLKIFLWLFLQTTPSQPDLTKKGSDFGKKTYSRSFLKKSKINCSDSLAIIPEKTLVFG